jgi:hypothetical protein
MHICPAGEFSSLPGLAWSSLRWVIAFFTIVQLRNDPFRLPIQSYNLVQGYVV